MNHYPNPAPGMRLSQQMFQDIFKASLGFDAITRARQTHHDFGLIFIDGEPGIQLEVEGLEVFIHSLTAVNASGELMMILPVMKFSMRVQEKEVVYEMLAKPGDIMNAFGEVKHTEQHYREPFSSQQVHVSFVEKGCFNLDSNTLKIAEFEVDAGNITQLKYTPACFQINAFPPLRKIFLDYKSRIQFFRNALLDILKRISKSRNNSTLDALYHICDRMLAYIHTKRLLLENFNENDSPLVWLDFMAGLMSVLEQFLQTHEQEASVIQLLKQHTESRIGNSSLNHEDIVQISQQVSALVYQPTAMDKVISLLKGTMTYVIEPFIYVSKAEPILEAYSGSQLIVKY